MKKEEVLVEIEFDEERDLFIMNMVFVDTGEIRQKRRSGTWVAKRLFDSEIRTMKKDRDVEISICDVDSTVYRR